MDQLSGTTARADVGRSGVLAALCVTTTVSYGILYYAFTVLHPDITRDTGWSGTAVTWAFSAGSLAGAVAGIGVGRVIQRVGPRWVMTGASALGTAALVGVAVAPAYPVFLVCWLFVGVATSGLFYPPAFAALTGWFRERRVQAITTLTLAAGFASTIFAPVTEALRDELGWRDTYLVLAAGLGLVTLPLHALALRPAWPGVARGRTPHRDRDVLASPAFLLLTTGCTLVVVAEFSSLVHLVGLLTDRGLSPSLAAWALGLGGAGQVAGRLFFPWLVRSVPPRPRAVAVTLGIAGTVAVLAVVPGPAAVLVAASIAAGVARGLFTLVTATVVADHWGPERYAAINGVFNAPLTVGTALAPAAGALLLAWTGSYTGAYTVLAVLAGLGGLLLSLPAAARAAQTSAA